MTSPSLLILGTDAVLAASPATPVQLTHACLAAGYRAVVPVSWGDEIVARRVLDAIENTNGPLVLCGCPMVARRLGRHASDLGCFTLATVAPPVAAAAYLRALYAPAGVRITFAGGCPAAAHGLIDAWLTPNELLAALAQKGISLADQPTEFDSVLPPDRRRYYSDPGGVPSPEALRRLTGAPELVELETGDFAVDLAQQLLAGGKRLIDVAPALGCACSGAGAGGSASAARARIRASEPPRAPSPVVDHDLPLDIDIVSVPAAIGMPHPGSRERTVSAQPPAPDPSPPPAARPARPSPEPAIATIDAPAESARRRPQNGGSRAVHGAMPQARASTGKRQLPRAYVARRRSSPKGVRHSAVRRQVDMLGPYRDQRTTPKWVWVAGVGAVLVGAIALLMRLF